MTAAWPIKNIRTARCNTPMEMRLRRRDVDMADRYRGMEFRLYGKEGDALMEEVANFNYLGRPLDQMYDE